MNHTGNLSSKIVYSKNCSSFASWAVGLFVIVQLNSVITTLVMRHLVYNVIYTYSVVPVNSSLHYNPWLIWHLVYKVRYFVVPITSSLHYNPWFIRHLVYNVRYSVVPINSSLRYNPRLIRHLVYNVRYSVVSINSSLRYNPRLIRHLVHNVRYFVVSIKSFLHYNPRFINTSSKTSTILWYQIIRHCWPYTLRL